MTSHALDGLVGSRRTLLHMQQQAADGRYGHHLESITSNQNPTLSVDAYLDEEQSWRTVSTCHAVHCVNCGLSVGQCRLSRSVLQSLVSSLVLSRLDYDNATLQAFHHISCHNCSVQVSSHHAYLIDELCQVADVEARQRLRSSSSSSLIVSRTRLRLSTVAARVGNSLPDILSLPHLP